jgi:hypothetical protein
MKLGTNDIGSVYLGTNAVSSIYIGTNLVWSGMDADYKAVLDYATTQGYTLPSASQRLLQEQLVIDLKDAGIWSKLDTFAVFATDGDEDFALIDWKRLSQYTAVNSPTFTTDEGFTGNGTSAYIDTNFDLSNLTTKLITNQQNISTGVWIRTVNELSIEYMLGNATSPDFRILSGNNTTTSTRYMGSRTQNNWSGTGLMSIHRTFNALVADVTVFNNATDVTAGLPTNIYNSITGLNIFVLRQLANYNANQVSFFYSGDSLVSEITDFNNALNTYITSI